MTLSSPFLPRHDIYLSGVSCSAAGYHHTARRLFLDQCSEVLRNQPTTAVPYPITESVKYRGASRRALPPHISRISSGILHFCFSQVWSGPRFIRAITQSPDTLSAFSNRSGCWASLSTTTTFGTASGLSAGQTKLDGALVRRQVRSPRVCQ